MGTWLKVVGSTVLVCKINTSLIQCRLTGQSEAYIIFALKTEQLWLMKSQLSFRHKTRNSTYHPALTFEVSILASCGAENREVRTLRLPLRVVFRTRDGE
jgi:hypothetical protein